MTPVNKALLRPILIAGVEKQLILFNALVCFPLIAATHLKFPSCLLAVVVFLCLHAVFSRLSKHDPQFSLVFRRATKHAWRPFYYAKSHPLHTEVACVYTIARM